MNKNKVNQHVRQSQHPKQSQPAKQSQSAQPRHATTRTNNQSCNNKSRTAFK